MARLFPLRSETPAREGTPRVVDLDDEDADAVFGALASNTARRIYARLDDEPGTPSDVAESIDSSIQNVRYHLEKLENAGLIEVVDTWYSSRGNEMSVYATANGPLIVTSDQSRAAQLKEALSRFVGGIGVLAGASVVVQAAAQHFGSSGFAADGASGGDAAEDIVGDDVTEGAAGDDAGESAGDSAAEDGFREDAAGTAEDDAVGDAPGDSATEDVPDDGAVGESAEHVETDLDAQSEDEPATDDDTTATDDENATDDERTTDDTTATDDVGDGPSGDAPPDDTASPSSGADSTDTLDTVTDVAAETLEGFFSWLSPGLAFFLGGLAVLTVLAAWWYVGTYRSIES